jgi:hypothetical protein
MGLFSKTKKVPLEDIRAKEAQALGKDFLSTLQQTLPKYKPGAEFGTRSVALTPQEERSIGFLDQYLGQDIRESDLYQAGRGEISDTLAGTKYDPTTGEYYKATRAGIERAKEGAIEEARRGQAVRGSFRSSGALRQEGDILTESNLATQQLFAQLAERERERRRTAGKEALQLAEFETNIPLTKTQAAQTFGALRRQNEIDNLEREYTKWRDQRAELMSAFETAGKASNLGQPIYGKTSVEVSKPTFLGEAVGLATQAIPLFSKGGIFGKS